MVLSKTRVTGILVNCGKTIDPGLPWWVYLVMSGLLLNVIPQLFLLLHIGYEMVGYQQGILLKSQLLTISYQKHKWNIGNFANFILWKEKRIFVDCVCQAWCNGWVTDHPIKTLEIHVGNRYICSVWNKDNRMTTFYFEETCKFQQKPVDTINLCPLWLTAQIIFFFDKNTISLFTSYRVVITPKNMTWLPRLLELYSALF